MSPYSNLHCQKIRIMTTLNVILNLDMMGLTKPSLYSKDPHRTPSDCKCIHILLPRGERIMVTVIDNISYRSHKQMITHCQSLTLSLLSYGQVNFLSFKKGFEILKNFVSFYETYLHSTIIMLLASDW